MTARSGELLGVRVGELDAPPQPKRSLVGATAEPSLA